ncbi:MAG: thioredoxin domain-containing protein, partial [Lentisphaeria bacterium]
YTGTVFMHQAPKNRLQNCSSPYLQQHADNPVDWFPWGEEALQKAKDEDKPIFLSIGYSTCHWCHVMARESFEDPQVAEFLNRYFVPVKVDREERPDLDMIYVNAVQLMTGSAGWPLSVFLTPNLVPFYGGTYFPPDSKRGFPSFLYVLKQISEAWQNQRSEIEGKTDQVTEALTKSVQMAKSSASEAFAPDQLKAACNKLKEHFDQAWGGFEGAPKFPPHGALNVFMQQYIAEPDEELLDFVELTLQRMAEGGIYDHLGGGFHRYATDQKWRIPHFEKMLYDNALLADVYLKAYQITGEPFYKQTALETVDYLINDLQTPAGGFCAAEDAESEDGEGVFYMWNAEQIDDAMEPDEAQLIKKYYGVPSGQPVTLNIQFSAATLAQEYETSEEKMTERLATCRRKLLNKRNQRSRPGRDDKVIAAWNGLAISALARAAAVTGEERICKAVEKVADFTAGELITEECVYHSWRNGKTSAIPGYLDDYANLANAMLDLYQTTFQLKWFRLADKLCTLMMQQFWNPETAQLYYTSSSHTHLLADLQPGADLPLPSSAASAALALLKLGHLKTEPEIIEQGENILQKRLGLAKQQPDAFMFTLAAADFAAGQVSEIVVAGEKNEELTEKFLSILRNKYLPRTVLSFIDTETPDADKYRQQIPLLAEKYRVEGKPAVYICQGFTCQRPITQAEELRQALAAE